MRVILEFLGGPAAGTVHDTDWSVALPSLYWTGADHSGTGVVYHRGSDRPDAVTGGGPAGYMLVRRCQADRLIQADRRRTRPCGREMLAVGLARRRSGRRSGGLAAVTGADLPGVSECVSPGCRRGEGR